MYLFASITLGIRRMTGTVFDHIMEYSFEDDKKPPQLVLHIQCCFFQSVFRH